MLGTEHSVSMLQTHSLMGAYKQCGSLHSVLTGESREKSKRDYQLGNWRNRWKKKRSTLSRSSPRDRPGKASLMLEQNLKGIKILVPGNPAVPPRRFRPQTTVCTVGNGPEMSPDHCVHRG